jgi:diguanylate cyclase (GGDEF)-like protein
MVCESVHSAEAVQQLAERLLDRLNQPMPLEGHTVHVAASIGIALSRDEDDTTTLIRRADAAMYQAKAAGRNRIHLTKNTLI